MRTVEVKVWDDLDHEQPASQTRTIGLDGVWYEIDLGDVHAKELDEFLQPFLNHGRRSGGRQRSTKLSMTEAPAKPVVATAKQKGHDQPRQAKSQTQRSLIRAWNRRLRDWHAEQGTGNRSKYISTEMVLAYRAAHPDDPMPQQQA